MPIYEYQCDHCSEVFEIFHKIDEDCKVACPKCLRPAKKLISATNFVLKGSGFYVNDYPSKSRQEGKRAEKEASGKGPSEKAEKSPEKEASGKGPSEKAEKSAEKAADKKA